MEVVVPAAAADFIFDSASTTPYVSAPSSPRPFGSDWPSARYYYTSAPTSPARAAAIFREFSTAVAGSLSSPRPPSSSSAHRSSVTPFDWEEKEHKEEDDAGDQVDDFAFEFSGQLEMGSGSPLTADELFDRGMIRPLKPPPRLQYAPPVGGGGAAWDKASVGSPRSPRSPKSPKSPRSKSSFLLPWRKQDDFDPFAKAIEETTRGRDRSAPRSKPPGATRRAARSLSPLRGTFDFGGKPSSATSAESSSAAAGSMGVDAAPGGGPAAAASTARWSRKWRLRDLLLFRSASEGRATGGGKRDPLRKYTALSPSSAAMLSRKGSGASVSSAGSREEVRNGSFRSSDGGSVGGSSRRGGGAGGSAHGRHYAGGSRAAAAAEETRRKTMLPYQQGLFGCLVFNPAINGLAKGFSSFSRSRS